jgi:CheY-like chemotaxis protein
VVSNLLTNAAKYTPPGGEIQIQAEACGDYVVLHVRDTGIGIAESMLPRIFDLFVQERQGLDRSQGGLGIGLAIVRSLVELHGGAVSVRSEGPGKGSEFSVRLPAAGRADTAATPARSITAESTAAAREAERPSVRILVVDDNEDAAEMLAEVLGDRGYETRFAHDAPSALRIATEFAPAVAFLDIGLPVMDGYELAAHLRALPGLSDIQLIALTGYGQESDRRRTQEAGFHDHLVKPIDVERIDATLRLVTARFATLTSPSSGVPGANPRGQTAD